MRHLEQWDLVTLWSIRYPHLAAIVTFLSVELDIPWVEHPGVFDLMLVTDPAFPITFQSNENPPALDVFPNAYVLVSD